MTERLIQAFFYNNPDSYPPVINGARLLAKAGFKLEMDCRDDGTDWKIEYPASLTIHRLKSSKSGSPREYLSFCRQAIRLGNSQATAFIGRDMHGLVPARLLAARHKRPLVYHCYDYSGDGYVQTLGGHVIKKLQTGFARRANLVTVPDEGLGEILHRELGLKQTPVVMANSPISHNREGGALRLALQAGGHAFEKIVFRQGRVGPGHALEVTIRSIPFWKSRNWGFVVMGLTDESYLRSLQKLALELGVQNQFVWLPPVSYDLVADFTKDADLGHALYEPIHVNNLNISGSCKIHEYMSVGLPLLVSDRPSLRSLVEGHACGIVADDSSPERIASTINQFFENSGRAMQMGSAATLAFENKFRFEFQFRPVLDALERSVRNE